MSIDRLLHYQGRRSEDPRDPFPHEKLEDGCPGGWRRAPFGRTFLGMVRKRTTTGGRVPNPFFDRVVQDRDDVLMSAILAYEAYEDANHAYFAEARAEEERRRRQMQPKRR